MAELQLKRGAPGAVSAYTGPMGEITVDTQNWNLALHDGVNAGGTTVGANVGSISAPEIISPVDRATDVTAQPVVQTSAFSGDGTHVASRFQFAADAAFKTILHDSGRHTDSLLSYSLIAASVHLPAGQVIYLRALHESDTAGESSWGSVTSFTVIEISAGSNIDGDIVVGQMGNDWLLAAPAAKRGFAQWGLYNIDTIIPNSSDGSTLPGQSSKQNTDTLTHVNYSNATDANGVTGCPAAEYTRVLDGGIYDLPTNEELQLIRDNQAAIDANDYSGGVYTLAFLNSSVWVWTSAEYNALQAWRLHFQNGIVYQADKSHNSIIVPVRRIPI